MQGYMNEPKRVLRDLKQLRMHDKATEYIPTAAEAQMTLLATAAQLDDQEFDYWCNVYEYHAPTDPMTDELREERYGRTPQ